MTRYDTLKNKPKRFLSLTGYTLEEFTALVLHFTQRFLRVVEAQTLEGKPRKKRRYTSYKNRRRTIVKVLCMKLLTGLICVLLCILNSTPVQSEKDAIADLNRKTEYAVVIMDADRGDFIAGMAKSYIKRYFGKMGIEIKDKPTSVEVSNYTLSLIGSEKGNKFEIFVVYGMAPLPSTGTMPDDLEAVSVDIAKRFQKFIEFGEEFNEKFGKK